MYINEIKVLSDRLQAFGEMNSKGGNWAEYVEKTLKEMEEAIAGLRTELDVRSTKNQPVNNVWAEMVSKENRPNTTLNQWD